MFSLNKSNSHQNCETCKFIVRRHMMHLKCEKSYFATLPEIKKKIKNRPFEESLKNKNVEIKKWLWAYIFLT